MRKKLVVLVLFALALVAIIVISLFPGQGTSELMTGIFLMDADGTDISQIYGSYSSASCASASPDGAKLAFYEFSGELSDISASEIYVINSDGTGYKRLTNNTWMDFQPKWLSDSEILFVSNPENVGTDLYVMDINGNILRQLTDTPGISEADPETGCGKIVYTREHSIWIMKEDGSGQEKVTEPPGKGEDVGVQFPKGDYDPDISPDCDKIVFSRLTGPGVFVEGIYVGDYDLYVHDLSSGEETEISNSIGADFVPKWAESIMFIHIGEDVLDRYDIYFTNPDGSERTKLMNNELRRYIETGAVWTGEKIAFTAMYFG